MEKLLLENFDEKLAFELLKKENFGSDIIKVDWTYEEGLEERDFEKINKIKWENNLEDYKMAVHYYLEENSIDGIRNEINEKELYLVNRVLKEYTNYQENSDEYERMSEKLYEVVIENFKEDYAIEDLLSYSEVSELTIFVEKKEKYGTLENELDRTTVFTDYMALKNDLEFERKFNGVTFLIQSQGYELEDLYDKEKIASSKFLTSLHENLEEFEGGALFFSKIGTNALDAIELQTTNENIVVPKEIYVGFFDFCNGSGVCDIELEKDIVLNKEDVLILSDFNNETNMYLIQETFGLIDTEQRINFKTTDEKGFEMHEVNVDKVLEKASKYLEYEMEKEEEMEYE